MPDGSRQEEKNWAARPFDAQRVERLIQQTAPLGPRLSPLLAQLFLGRGITDPKDVAAALSAPNLSTGLRPPEQLPGCVEAAEKILAAIRAEKRIAVYGDYDVDGMTATAILVEAITLAGGSAKYYVPNRLDEGYGLNCDALDRLSHEGIGMVITVDCGISSLKEALHARQIGLDLVITDHHTILTDPETGKQILPDAAAITHPRLLLDGVPPYPFPELCGAVVAFKLAWALERAAEGTSRVSAEKRRFLIKAVGLAALGTVADVVPLWDENRTLVRFALEKSFGAVFPSESSDAAESYVPIGLCALVAESGIASRARKKITSEDIGFSIAPRLNAAGREVLCESSPKDEIDEQNWKAAKALLEHPDRLAAAGQMGLASLGVELLVTQSAERAGELAHFINNLNESRQKLERKIMHEALEQIKASWQDAPAFVLASAFWHPGVIGIVAGRLAEQFNRPTVMISLQNRDPGTGSGRGIPDSDFNLYNAFEACKEHLTRFGGHAAAAGLGIRSDKIDAFRSAFCDYVAEHYHDTGSKTLLRVDGEFPLSAFTNKTLAEIDALAPFGADNTRPVFVSYGVTLSAPARRVGGKNRKPSGSTSAGNAPDTAAGAKNTESTDTLGRTFQAKFRQWRDERRAVAFGRGDWVDEMNALYAANAAAAFDIAFQVVYNDYFGQVELRLLDWRTSTSTTPEASYVR